MVIPVYDQYSFKRQKGTDFDKSVAAWLMNASAYAHNQFYGWTSYPAEVEQGKQLSWHAPASKLGPYAGYIGTMNAKDLEANPIVIAIRGTLEWQDWLADADLVQKVIDIPTLGIRPRVHDGFWNVYTKRDPKETHSLQEQVREEVSHLLAEAPNREIYITGHSLGAAIANFITVDLALLYPKNNIINYNFASPRAGSPFYANAVQYLMKSKERHFVYWSMINSADIVPNLPPSVTRNLHFSHIEPQMIFSWSRSSYLENHQLIAYHAGLIQKLPLKIAFFGTDKKGKIEREGRPGRTYEIVSLAGDVQEQLTHAKSLDGAVFVVPLNTTLSRALLEKLFLIRAAEVQHIVICVTGVQGIDREVVEQKIQEIRKWLKKVELLTDTVAILEIDNHEVCSETFFEKLDLYVTSRIILDSIKIRKRKNLTPKLLAQVRPVKGAFKALFPSYQGQGSLKGVKLEKRESIHKGDYFLIVSRGKIVGLGSVKALGWF